MKELRADSRHRTLQRKQTHNRMLHDQVLSTATANMYTVQQPGSSAACLQMYPDHSFPRVGLAIAVCV